MPSTLTSVWGERKKRKKSVTLETRGIIMMMIGKQ